MCLICIEFNKLSDDEVSRNLGEMRSNLGDHADEVQGKLNDRRLSRTKDLIDEELEGFIGDYQTESLERMFSDFDVELWFNQWFSLAGFDPSEDERKR